MNPETSHPWDADTPAQREIGDVLIVDDNEAAREIVRTTLESVGFSVREAATGRGGIAQILRSDYRLVLLDLQLPDIPGEEVLEMMRRLPGVDTCLIIGFTAFHGRAAEFRRRGIAFNDYLLKPIDPLDLIQKIQDWLGDRPVPLNSTPAPV
jgi:CheY-like chemotaxis protein